MDEINILPFKCKYLPLLHEMLEAQGYPNPKEITMRTLPKIGYIAMINNQPVAAGFLRKVECNVIAQIDGLTSNPYFGSILRHVGINKVLDSLILDAKQLKLKGIVAFTSDETVLKRAEAIGFHKVEHSIVSLSF